MEDKSLKNLLILGPVVALLAYASYKLYLEYLPQEVDSDLEIERSVIGLITNATQNVKRKTGDSLLWDPLEKGDEIYTNDSVRTGLSSTTTIQLQDNSKIELDENSLILLGATTQNLNVNFKTGEFKAFADSQRLKIKVRDSVLTGNKSNIRIRTGTNSDAQIQVTKGRATLLEQNGKKIELDAKKIAKIDQAGRAEAMRVRVILSSPKNKIKILNSSEKINYPFTWAVLDSNLKKQLFQIDTSPNFNSTSKIERWANQAIEARLLRGKNYWRVGWYAYDQATKSRQLQFSPIQSIELKNDERIQLLFPENASTFTQEPGNTNLNFRWKSKYSAKLFLFELSAKQDFSQIIINKRLNKPEVSFKNLESGNYYWRVSAFDNNNKLIGQSSAGRFAIDKLIPNAPKLIYPVNNFVWTMPEALRFEWAKYIKAVSYQIVISSSSDMRTIVYQATTKDLFISWKWSNPANYFWQVKALDVKQNIIAESTKHQFAINSTISNSAITLRFPKDQSEELKPNSDSLPPVEFLWQPKENLNPNYELQVAKNADFKKVLKKTNIKDTSLKLQLNEPGVYFWKVIWTNPDKPEDIKKSSMFTFRLSINKNLPPVELELPKLDAQFEVYPEEVLDFSWLSQDKAKQYRIVIERKISEELYKKIVDRKVVENKYQKNNFRPGFYRWHVIAVDENGTQGMKSEVRQLKIDRDKGLEAPTLNPAVVK
ncbi:MAG: hypothetical protein AB8E15_08645 [Bdellovibrionales bacterium]